MTTLKSQMRAVDCRAYRSMTSMNRRTTRDVTVLSLYHNRPTTPLKCKILHRPSVVHNHTEYPTQYTY